MIATLFGRDGEIAGKYHKTHLPPDETWNVSPGNTLNVIKCENITIGFSICHDMAFAESVAVLKQKGAELILHPTHGYGLHCEKGKALFSTRAFDNGVYIALSKNYISGASGSGVVAPCGKVLAETLPQENAIAVASVDFDEGLLDPEWLMPSVMSGERDPALRKERERRPDLYHPLTAPLKNPFVPPDEKKRAEIVEKIRCGECHW